MLDVFFYIQLSFSIFGGFKSQLSNSYDNWYVQKYLKGIFHKGILLIWKKYFMHVILSFSSPRCAIIARLNVMYTKFRRAMIAQLNKIWCVWACAFAIARYSWPGLLYGFWDNSTWSFFIRKLATFWYVYRLASLQCLSVILKLVFPSILDVDWINVNKCFVFDWAILLFHRNLIITLNKTETLNFRCGSVAIFNYCKKLTYEFLHIAAVNYLWTRRFLVTSAE